MVAVYPETQIVWPMVACVTAGLREPGVQAASGRGPRAWHVRKGVAVEILSGTTEPAASVAGDVCGATTGGAVPVAWDPHPAAATVPRTNAVSQCRMR